MKSYINTSDQRSIVGQIPSYCGGGSSSIVVHMSQDDEMNKLYQNVGHNLLINSVAGGYKYL